MVKKKLPKHLAVLLDTPAKRKRANKIMAAGRREYLRKIKKLYSKK